MPSERGQATVEWVGLLLLLALVLGGLVAFAPRLEGRSLGAAVAHRIVCAAHGGCVAGGVDGPRGAPGARGLQAGGLPPSRLGRRRALRVPAARRLAGMLFRRAWIACVGYHRYRYERSHPERLSPFDQMPLGEGLKIADACLNPVGYLRHG